MRKILIIFLILICYIYYCVATMPQIPKKWEYREFMNMDEVTLYMNELNDFEADSAKIVIEHSCSIYLIFKSNQ